MTTAKPIWSKRTATGGGPSERLVAYCAGRDVVARPQADASLIPYDLWTNRAHCLMLKRQGIIAPAIHARIARGLAALEKDWQEGRFELDPALEDVHMNVERYVAAAQGEAAGGAMHTARSRNDQSATDVRLWLREALLEKLNALSSLIQALATLARTHATTIAPGWTHAQPAMPTTLGHWAASHAWALARDARALQDLWPLINQSPLGAAASFGSSWPVDRALTARLLGFDAPQPNSLDAISTRWECEARVGQALAIMMSHLSSLGQDLIHLSSPPWCLVRLSDSHVTGSSIMPNKRNPDFAEVTRARALSVQSLVQNLLGVCRGALSGYNRDTQWSKYWIMDLIDEVGAAGEIFRDALEGLVPDKARLAEAATEGFSLAADLADHLARTRQLPFRRAYHVVAEAVARDEAHGWVTAATMNDILKREKIKPAFTEEEIALAGQAPAVLARRNSLGGPAPEDVRAQAKALSALGKQAEKFTAATRRTLTAARAKAWGK